MHWSQIDSSDKMISMSVLWSVTRHQIQAKSWSWRFFPDSKKFSLHIQFAHESPISLIYDRFANLTQFTAHIPQASASFTFTLHSFTSSRCILHSTRSAKFQLFRSFGCEQSASDENTCHESRTKQKNYMSFYQVQLPIHLTRKKTT